VTGGIGLQGRIRAAAVWDGHRRGQICIGAKNSG